MEGRPLVEATIKNRGNAPLEKVTLINRTSASIEPIKITPEYTDKSEFFEDELLVDLGRVGPGQQVKMEISYDVLNVDPTAFSEITVTTPAGASASRSILLQGNGNGAGNNPNGQGGIDIPFDNTPLDQGTLSVDVKSIDQNIGLGQQSRVEFTVKNNSRQSFRNVDIRVLVPPSMNVVRLTSDTSTLKFVEKYRIETIKDLRAGEALTWTLLVEGRAAGPGRLEVQAKSDDTEGIAAGSDVVNVGN